MKKLSLILLLVSIASCKNNQSTQELETKTKKEVYVDSIYTLDEAFEIGDVRRYGVLPGKGIGQHPKLLKDKLQVLLDISEVGIELFFPKGVYDRTFNIDGRNGVQIVSDSAIFTGAINIKNSENVKINGVIQSLTQFYTQEANNIKINTIITKTDSIIKGNSIRSTGCSIHGGSKNITINKVIVEDLGSGSEQYKYIKAGFIIHGHNNEPSRIKVDTVIVKSSDRHGVYLSGDEVDIKFLHIQKFGVGSSENMAKMEGGIEGEQLDFSGLWIKNCYNSFINEVVIDIENSKGKYIFNFDIGEEFRPTIIDKLTINGLKTNNQLEKRVFSRTGVKLVDLIEN